MATRKKAINQEKKSKKLKQQLTKDNLDSKIYQSDTLTRVSNADQFLEHYKKEKKEKK